MPATITVTACDNELIILAYPTSAPNASFELCRILSGNNTGVNVTLTVQPGTYTGPIVLNGPSNSLNLSVPTCVTSGSYSLLLLGVNWGGVYSFTVNVNGTIVPGGSGSTGTGLVWNPGPISITV